MTVDSYAYQYLFLGVFFIATVIFALLPIVLAKLIAPRKPNPIKTSSYECGIESQGDSWIQFKVQYYIYALIFVIFDIEVIFIYPWAVAYNQMGLFALVEMFIFLAILALGLVYAWKKKVLEWK